MDRPIYLTLSKDPEIFCTECDSACRCPTGYFYGTIIEIHNGRYKIFANIALITIDGEIDHSLIDEDSELYPSDILLDIVDYDSDVECNLPPMTYLTGDLKNIFDDVISHGDDIYNDGGTEEESYYVAYDLFRLFDLAEYFDCYDTINSKYEFIISETKGVDGGDEVVDDDEAGGETKGIDGNEEKGVDGGTEAVGGDDESVGEEKGDDEINPDFQHKVWQKYIFDTARYINDRMDPIYSMCDCDNGYDAGGNYTIKIAEHIVKYLIHHCLNTPLD